MLLFARVSQALQHSNDNDSNHDAFLMYRVSQMEFSCKTVLGDASLDINICI
jgi:hypothetical protein